MQELEYEDVQLRKVATLMRHYKMFIMKKDEIIDEIFRRFQIILDGVQSLGHIFSKAQNNLKILDSLPKLWGQRAQSSKKYATRRRALKVHEVHLQKEKKKLVNKDLLNLKIGETSTKKSKKLEK
ncbi:hypothetical protein CR513_09427, partial [Mucuna pruriens]